MWAYLNEGYAEPVPEKELSSDEVYYMPHRAVIKDESTTTKKGLSLMLPHVSRIKQV